MLAFGHQAWVFNQIKNDNIKRLSLCLDGQTFVYLTVTFLLFCDVSFNGGREFVNFGSRFVCDARLYKWVLGCREKYYGGTGLEIAKMTVKLFEVCCVESKRSHFSCMN